MAIPEAVQDAIDDAVQSIVPADLRARGWRYVDPPTRFSLDMWDLFCRMIGDGEYKILAMTHGVAKDGFEYKRGQFIVSPVGLDRLSRIRERASEIGDPLASPTPEESRG